MKDEISDSRNRHKDRLVFRCKLPQLKNRFCHHRISSDSGRIRKKLRGIPSAVFMNWVVPLCIKLVPAGCGGEHVASTDPCSLCSANKKALKAREFLKVTIRLAHKAVEVTTLKFRGMVYRTRTRALTGKSFRLDFSILSGIKTFQP